MKVTLLIIAAFIGALVALSSGWPLDEEYLQPYQYEQYEPYQPSEITYQQIRERRSPQYQSPPPPNRGSISITGGHTPGSGSFARGDYDHKIWQGRNGARLDANTFYQRNWGGPGPKQDYGGGVKFSVPFGG